MFVFSCESSRALIVSATRCMDARRSTERAWSRATESTTERSARMSSRISMRSSRCVIPSTPGSSPLMGLGDGAGVPEVATGRGAREPVWIRPARRHQL